MKRIQNERGIALAIAIFALVVIGALVAGSFFLGNQEQQVGRNTLASQQAFSAAQQGGQAEVANWSTGKYNGMNNGDSATFSGSLTDGTGTYTGKVRRLNNLVFLVETEGRSANQRTRQKVGLLVRLRPIELTIKASLTTQGQTQIGGSSYLDGSDRVPSTWTGCPALKPTLPAIRINDSTKIQTSGCSNYSCLNGSPKIQQDTSINSNSLLTFGDAKFDDLKAMATMVISGGTRKIQPSLTGGACNKSDNNNWGDPLNPAQPCGGYFPIIFVTGDLSINGVEGQGVLVVDGSLSVQGGFEFFGPVIVRNSLKTTGTGGHFNGGVIAGNVELGQNTVLGDAVVNYSSCAILRALTNSAPGALMQERGWVNLYN